MIKIRRYGLSFGPVLWLQTHKPVKVRHWWWFWFLKEAKPDDVDSKQEFPEGTPLVHEGKKYRYFKAERDYKAGEVVFLDESK